MFWAMSALSEAKQHLQIPPHVCPPVRHHSWLSQGAYTLLEIWEMYIELVLIEPLHIN